MEFNLDDNVELELKSGLLLRGQIISIEKVGYFLGCEDGIYPIFLEDIKKARLVN